MMKKNNYYVYRHFSPKDFSVFYVGIGKNDRVFDGGSKRNRSWRKKVWDEGGFLFDIVEKDITKELALEIERELIIGYGIENLCNVVGEGGNSTAFKKGQTPWNKGLKGAQATSTKKVLIDGVTYSSVNDAIKNIGIGKTTFYRWVKKGKVQYV